MAQDTPANSPTPSVSPWLEPDIAEIARLREQAGKRIDPMDICPQGTTRDEVAKGYDP